MLTQSSSRLHRSRGRWQTAVAATTAALVLAGCGAAGSEQSTSGTIEFPNWMWGDPSNARYWQALKEEFEEENPEYTLTDDVIPGGEYQDKMYTLLSSGNAPDLVTPFDQTLRAWMSDDLLEPLDPWLDEAGYNLESFIPANQLARGEDGQIYGVIYCSNPRVLFVNTALLDEHGLEVPTTPAEVRHVAQTLKNAGQGQHGFATMSASTSGFPTYGEILPIVKSFGGDFIKDGKATANAPATVEALEWIEAMHDDGLIPTGQTELVYREAFAQGQVANLVVGAFIMAVVKDKFPDTFANYTAVPMPFGAERTTSANGFLAIPKNAPNKEGAAAVISKMLEDKWQHNLVEMSWQTPARPDMVTDDFLAENPWFETVQGAVGVAESVAPAGVEELAPQIQDAVTARYQEMLFTDTTAEQAADAMQVDLEQILAR